jgi:hypothetical protein
VLVRRDRAGRGLFQNVAHWGLRTGSLGRGYRACKCGAAPSRWCRRPRLHFPPFANVHLVFDLLAWASAGLLARLLYKWRLAELASPLKVLSVGYALSLAAGAAAGAWIAGSLNTGILHPSHSIAGGLAGGIVAVELWKAAHGVRQSTGAFWVGPLALGIAVGRIGCFLAGLPDQTYGTALGGRPRRRRPPPSGAAV